MSYETSTTSTTSSAVKRLQQRPPPPKPQPKESPRSRPKSKSILSSITKKFAPRATRNVAPPVPAPPTSAEAQERREAALRLMGLRPTLTLSQQEALVDNAIPILPSPTSPTFSSPTALASEADRIKNEWESKNKSNVQDGQLARMINFKFGGSSTPNLSPALETEATDTDSDSSGPAGSLDLPSILSSAAHESVSSLNRTSISELEKCNEDFPCSCEQPSPTSGLSPPLVREIDPSMLPLPPSPSPSRVQGDALSVISSISKASRHEKADLGLNGGLSSSEAHTPQPPTTPSSTAGEAAHSFDEFLLLSTLNAPRVLTPPPPPPLISLSPPDPSSPDQVEEMKSSEVSPPDCASNLDVEADTAAPLTNLTADSCIPASRMTPATSPLEPPSDIQPSQDISESEVPGDDMIGGKSDHDGLDVVYEEPEMLSVSGSRVASRSGSLSRGRRSPSAPREAARSRSASRTREPLKVDNVIHEGGETHGSNLTVQDAEAEVKPLPNFPSHERAAEQPESSTSPAVPTTTQLPPKRGMTEGAERKKSVFNRFKRSNTTGAIPGADATEQVPPLPLLLPAKRSATVLSTVRRRVISTFGTSKSCLEPESSDKMFDASHYPPSPTSASSVFKSIQSVGNRSVSPAGGQNSTRGLSPVRQPVSPTMHNQASIAFQTNAIEDEETRRMAELAFLS